MRKSYLVDGALNLLEPAAFAEGPDSDESPGPTVCTHKNLTVLLVQVSAPPDDIVSPPHRSGCDMLWPHFPAITRYTIRGGGGAWETVCPNHEGGGLHRARLPSCPSPELTPHHLLRCETDWHQRWTMADPALLQGSNDVMCDAPSRPPRWQTTFL